MQIFTNFQINNPKISFEGRHRKPRTAEELAFMEKRALSPAKKRIWERQALVKELLYKGYEVNDIANICGVDKTTVARDIRFLGLTGHKNLKKEIRNELILQKVKNKETNKKISEDLNISDVIVRKVKREHGLIRMYKRLPQPQVFTWTEIIRESRKITELRETYQRFKKGERTKEILEEMSKKVNELKEVIDGFKSRLD